MTTIVINAVSVREGGSLVVLRELLMAMAQARPQWQWHVLTNAFAAPQLTAVANARFHVVEARRLEGWRIRLWYETALPHLLETVQADLLYSQTNYLPTRRLRCPSLLLVQHAGHFSPLFRRLTEQSLPSWPTRLSWRLKGAWVRASVRRATHVTVQTRALAQDIVADTGVDSAKLAVIAHGPGLTKAVAAAVPPPPKGQKLRIGYITKAGVQKNFGVLLAAAARLQQQGMPFTVVLTLDPADRDNRAVLAQAQALGLGDCVENHGELGAAAVQQLYESLHVFVFASLCESFGFPLVEAMAHALPLCVADTASNREVAGEAGLWFAADDATTLAQHLHALADDTDLFTRLSQHSLARAAAFSWDRAASGNIALIESLLPSSKSNAQ